MRLGKIRYQPQGAIITFQRCGVMANSRFRQAKIIQRYRLRGRGAQGKAIGLCRPGVITALPIHPSRIVMRRRIRGITPHGLPETFQRRFPLFKTKLREALIVPGLRKTWRQSNRALSRHQSLRIFFQIQQYSRAVVMRWRVRRIERYRLIQRRQRRLRIAQLFQHQSHIQEGTEKPRH